MRREGKLLPIALSNGRKMEDLIKGEPMGHLQPSCA
ncbi:hypothetical protein XFF6992_720006 [Xanthomonas citri pv. fuscans]|nr:hypothetical protein XFF6992_720006 [Xanthomonas citri pv. fuscans]